MSQTISKGQLAYFSIVLKAGLPPGELLNSHFRNNISAYKALLLRAIEAAKQGAFVVPRREGKQVQNLALEMNLHFGEIRGWNKVHWQCLAYLLVYTFQQERISQREGRWIHVEVHARALHFVISESGAKSDDVILSYLEHGEVQDLSASFATVVRGQSFANAAKTLRSTGLRETLRDLLELDERERGIAPAREPQIQREAKAQAAKWNREIDPKASLVRVRGIIHEPPTCELLTKYAVVPKHATATNVTTEELIAEILQPALTAPESKPEVRVGLQNPVPAKHAVQPQSYHRPEASISPESKEKWMIACLVIGFVASMLLVPQETFSAGVAWWYFLLGGGVCSLLMIVVPHFLFEQVEPRIDIVTVIGYAAILGIMTWLIKPDTYLFGIAWWHSIFGALILGTACMLAWPLIKASLRQQQVRFA